jgi:Bacterial EndoU nuclease
MNAECPILEPSRAMLSPASHRGSPQEQPLALAASNRLGATRALVCTLSVRVLGLCLLAVTVLGCMSSLADATEVTVDCTALARWTKRPKPPQVNQAHVFCGEWKPNGPGGFHARPGAVNPRSVAQFTVTQPANAKGIYGGSWSYTGHPEVVKFSTMFPDTCSMVQVLNSIVFAATHPSQCPVNAPHWAVCGPNRPTSTGQNTGPYCAAEDGTVFLIAMAKLRDGRVNTAFPLR